MAKRKSKKRGYKNKKPKTKKYVAGNSSPDIFAEYSSSSPENTRRDKCIFAIPEHIPESVYPIIRNTIPNHRYTNEQINYILKVKFELLCNITNGIVPDFTNTNANTNIAKMLTGHPNVVLSIMQYIAAIMNINTTAPVIYKYNYETANIEDMDKKEDRDNRIKKALKTIDNTNKITIVPVFLPEHMNIVIIHSANDMHMIELFEPNGYVPSTHTKELYEVIKYDCKKLARVIYPDIHTSQFIKPTRCRAGKCQSRMSKYDALECESYRDTCSVFSLWYMFNRIIYLDSETAEETIDNMDAIIVDKTPNYIIELINAFISVLSSDVYDLLIIGLQSVQLTVDGYKKYLKYAKPQLTRDTMSIIYNTVKSNNNAQYLEQALREENMWNSNYLTDDIINSAQ